ncbi:hypothetical protein BDV38DRAFT_283161 [Aspergillus pseudotamarii]|uniref:Uncharacterized protein n=1 Tax=Aspergillus pseudotamarii TaxID=132259 RepID=A0A5N6SRS5_ASPPS|nr:uncharacterized protein BDV38DRAFT_283161 [Aspergillus pseudotamarii]KAE8137322.1 hypothetical protein BDV38DRAFT_283161 [Aspergillus pseudotamarii]
MSSPLKEFKNLMVREGQLRLDAGEVKDGKKRVYLQVSSQATNESLQKWRNKNSSHANLAAEDINVDDTKDHYPDVFDNLWEDFEKQAKDKLSTYVRKLETAWLKEELTNWAGFAFHARSNLHIRA